MCASKNQENLPMLNNPKPQTAPPEKRGEVTEEMEPAPLQRADSTPISKTRLTAKNKSENKQNRNKTRMNTIDKSTIKPARDGAGDIPMNPQIPPTVEPDWLLCVGDGNTGKTTDCRNIAEYLKLLDDPRVLLVDADEKPGFSKFGAAIHTLPIRCMDDAMRVRETAMKCASKVIFVDCPGTARCAIGQAFANLRQMSRRGLKVHLLLHTGGRGSSEAAEAWMREYDFLEEIIIVSNPMRTLTDQERAAHIKYLEGLQGPEKRNIIELPVLEHSVARALEKSGPFISDIIDGSYDGGDSHLTSPFGICAVEAWWEKDILAKQAIWDLFKRIL